MLRFPTASGEVEGAEAELPVRRLLFAAIDLPKAEGLLYPHQHPRRFSCLYQIGLAARFLTDIPGAADCRGHAFCRSTNGPAVEVGSSPDGSSNAGSPDAA